ncbi:MAG: hypothetical protein H0T46_10605 [Deltaproteobacteria bacterium]|nr:hypothetical protein [Deltaproteobacteria bacterium]
MLAVASIAVVAACADGVNDTDPSETSDVDNPAVATQPPEGSKAEAEGLVLAPNPVRCASDGPCSSACDPGMITSIHIPSGSCVVFDCSWNGSPDVGGCHP